MIKLQKGIRKVTKKDREDYNCMCDKVIDRSDGLVYCCDRVPTYVVRGSYCCGLHVPKRFKK